MCLPSSVSALAGFFFNVTVALMCPNVDEWKLKTLLLHERGVTYV